MSHPTNFLINVIQLNKNTGAWHLKDSTLIHIHASLRKELVQRWVLQNYLFILALEGQTENMF